MEIRRDSFSTFIKATRQGKKSQEDTSERMQPSFRTLKRTKAAKPGKGNTKGTLHSSLAVELQHQTTARYKLQSKTLPVH